MDGWMGRWGYFEGCGEGMVGGVGEGSRIGIGFCGWVGR